MGIVLEYRGTEVTRQEYEKLWSEASWPERHANDPERAFAEYQSLLDGE